LLEPILGQIIGLILGQDYFPHIITFIGAIGIIVGIGLTIKGNMLKEKTKEEDEIELLKDPFP